MIGRRAALSLLAEVYANGQPDDAARAYLAVHEPAVLLSNLAVIANTLLIGHDHPALVLQDMAILVGQMEADAQRTN